MTACPGCGQRIRAMAPVMAGYVGVPMPGDVSLCDNCGVVSRFDERLQLHELAPEDIKTLHPDDQRLLAIVQRKVADAKGPPN